MDRSVSRWQLAGFLFTDLAGTGLHFLFDLTGGNVIAGLFSAVNESIWEHMKLLYFPALLFSLWEYRLWGRETRCFWTIKALGLGLGLVLIPVLFYTYTGALGVFADWFNVTIFFLAAGAMYYLQARLFSQGLGCKGYGWVLFVLVGALFVAFTFWTPRLPLFRDPITGTYGYQG